MYLIIPKAKITFQSGVVLPIHKIIWFTELDKVLAGPATAVIFSGSLEITE